MRAGAHALTLLSAPVNVHVLTALEGGPMALVDLRRAAGSPPQTTARNHLRTLSRTGIVERHQEPRFPGSVVYELGTAGRELLEVARITRAWLAAAPDQPLDLGTFAAKNSIKALVDGWTSTVVRALAAGPLSLTQLSRLISKINYPSLERRLAAMRLAGQIATGEKQGGRSRPYSATPWLRRATAPLAAGAAWERRFLSEANPPTGIDIEAFFLLAVPLLRLPPEVSGTSRLAVELRGPQGRAAHAGVVVRVAEGAIASCLSRLDGPAEGWASGTLGAWLDATIEGRVGGLEIGGDGGLAGGLVQALHTKLFASPLALEAA